MNALVSSIVESSVVVNNPVDAAFVIAKAFHVALGTTTACSNTNSLSNVTAAVGHHFPSPHHLLSASVTVASVYVVLMPATADHTTFNVGVSVAAVADETIVDVRPYLGGR